MKVITGQLRATLNTDASRPPRLNGQSQIRQIGSSNPFSSVNPEYFLNQTQPGPPRTGRARRRMRREGTPSRPLSSRAPRRPRRLLPAPLSPLSQTPPPSYTELMMVPEPGLTQEQTIATAEMENVSNSKVETQEAEEPLLSGQDQSQAELHSTPVIRRLSLVASTTPPSTPLNIAEVSPRHGTIGVSAGIFRQARISIRAPWIIHTVLG